MLKQRSGDDQACTPEDPRDMRRNFFGRAMNGYVPRLYPDRVTLFLASELSVERSDDPTLGWCEVAKEVDVHLVPGDHLTSITRHVKFIAKKLRACLDEAQAAD